MNYLETALSEYQRQDRSTVRIKKQDVIYLDSKGPESRQYTQGILLI